MPLDVTCRASAPPRRPALGLLSCAALAAAGLGAGACGDDLPKPQLVDNLRIVGVRADPPEGPPGTAVTLSALVLHPDPAATIEQVWAVCVVVPGQPSSACAQAAAAGVPPACADAPEAPVCLLGMDPGAGYTLPARAVTGLGPGAAGEVVFTLIAADGPSGGLSGCLAALAGSEAVPAGCRTAVKRARVLADAQAPANQNPELESFTRDAAGFAVTLASGAAEATPDGPETLFLSWYVTGGELDKFRTDADAEGLANAWIAPATAGSYRAAVVVHDGRGGESWQTLDVTIP